MSPSRTLALFALVLAAAVALGLNASRSADAKPKQGGGNRHGIYWGAQIGDQLTGEQAPWDMSAVY
jgi:hypothetical protein